MKIRIHDFVESTTALGPGTRCAIWLQGCKRNCKGCMSPESRDMEGGYIEGVDSLAEHVLAINGIEGITISGGDPFYQPDALLELLKIIKSKSNLGVIIYTGFYFDELKEMNNAAVEEIITNLSDLIIDGPYVEELNDDGYLRGSSNQQLNFITSRYKKQLGSNGSEKREVEIIIQHNKLTLVGIPSKFTLNKWEEIKKSLDGETMPNKNRFD